MENHVKGSDVKIDCVLVVVLGLVEDKFCEESHIVCCFMPHKGRWRKIKAHRCVLFIVYWQFVSLVITNTHTDSLRQPGGTHTVSQVIY